MRPLAARKWRRQAVGSADASATGTRARGKATARSALPDRSEGAWLAHWCGGCELAAHVGRTGGRDGAGALGRTRRSQPAAAV